MKMKLYFEDKRRKTTVEIMQFRDSITPEEASKEQEGLWKAAGENGWELIDQWKWSDKKGKGRLTILGDRKTLREKLNVEPNTPTPKFLIEQD